MGGKVLPVEFKGKYSNILARQTAWHMPSQERTSQSFARLESYQTDSKSPQNQTRHLASCIKTETVTSGRSYVPHATRTICSIPEAMETLPFGTKGSERKGDRRAIEGGGRGTSQLHTPTIGLGNPTNLPRGSSPPYQPSAKRIHQSTMQISLRRRAEGFMRSIR